MYRGVEVGRTGDVLWLEVLLDYKTCSLEPNIEVVVVRSEVAVFYITKYKRHLTNQLGFCTK